MSKWFCLAEKPAIWPEDQYERLRQEELEYRRRRERGEPFTLWDFQVFARMNADSVHEMGSHESQEFHSRQRS